MTEQPDARDRIAGENTTKIYEGFKNKTEDTLLPDNKVNQEKTQPKTQITSDVPLGHELSPETIEARKKLMEEIAEAEAREFPYATCPIEGHLLRATEFDSNGKPVKFFCPKCHKETSTPIIKKYKPQLRSYQQMPDEKREPKIEPQIVANDIAANYLFITDRRTETLYRYDDERHNWVNDGDLFLKEILVWHLTNRNRKSIYDNVLHCLKSATLEEMTFSTQFIATENGLLDVEHNILTEFTPNAMTKHSIPVTFNKEADCPNFKEFLKQILAPDDILTLQEWSGYLLLPDYREHKILFCYGVGRNGKGVWTRTMEGILGEENCSSIPLENFNGYHRFAMERLFGKLFNTCNEPVTGYNYVLQTSLLKAATGQDTIDAEIKCRQKTLRFRNTAKITVIANRFPKVEDNTTAFKERRLFITFPREFIGSNKITDLEEVWLTNPEEKSGILNWMLEGLQRLLKNGKFTESRSQQETETAFLRASDTIGAFLKEIAVIDRTKTKYAGRKEALEAYKEYCEYYGLENLNEKILTQRLKDTRGISEGKRFIQSLGKRDRAWVGLELKKLPEDSESGTDGTAGMNYYTQTNLSNDKKIEESKDDVPSVPLVPESDVENYQQLVCYFCQKGIMDNDWTQDDFTENKPAHKKCYDEKKAQLREREETERDYGQPGEAF
jgi:P4 family phage/plasmid primase-like protien